MTCAVHTARSARRVTGDGQCGTAKWQRRMRGLLYTTLSTSPYDLTDNLVEEKGNAPQPDDVPGPEASPTYRLRERRTATTRASCARADERNNAFRGAYQGRAETPSRPTDRHFE